MKNHLLHTIIFFFCCSGAFAQNPLVKQWDKRFGGSNSEQVRWLEKTVDGGYILGGISDSPTGGDKS